MRAPFGADIPFQKIKAGVIYIVLCIINPWLENPPENLPEVELISLLKT
jgi:hypothetical protein